MKEADAGFLTPADQTTFTAGDVFGSGTSVTVSRLTSGANYTAQIFEYSSQTDFETYLISPSVDNPKIQETALSNRIDIKSFVNNASFIFSSQKQVEECGALLNYKDRSIIK